MRNTVAALLLSVWLLLSIGCDTGTGTAGSSGSAGSTIQIVYIPKNTGNPYFDPLIEGIRKACEENGAVFSTVAPDSADATSQIPLIKDQIQRGVSAITISPNSPDALNPVLEEARSKGIRIVTVDSDLTGNEQYRDVGVLTVDPQTVGESQIELMGSLIGYKGKFAILSATTDAPNQNRWIEVMKQTLQSNPKYKDMQLVEIVYGNDEPAKSLTEAEALLTKYPDLAGIIAPTTVGVAAAAQAVETAKKADQVKVTGLGTPNQMRRFIKNGTVKAFALWSPYDEGYLSGYVACLLATGKLSPAPGVKFIAGSLGERQIREKNVVITGPPVTFTADNIDQYNF
ncbi:substrate-binding domain-containing protein [Fontivita pretiosa]|uniref:substrate-binding domain-containing protein n=1 Tax=Fontivita pretiosa TaxID=2989684 RepID=UPI003D163158